MSQVTLEAVVARLEKLEQAMQQLLQKEPGGAPAGREPQKKEPEPLVIKDWRKAVEFMASLPPGDEETQKQHEEILREMDEEDLRAAIEEADREDAEREGRR